MTAPEGYSATQIALHWAVGALVGLILAFVVWRLVLRLRRGVPDAPAQEPPELKRLAHVAHWGFYALLAAMALTGLAAWFADAVPAAQLHNVLKVALLTLIALHVAAIPFQSLVLKSDVMRRMLRPAG